EIGGDVLK
nr:56 kda actin-sequestering protein, ASP-56=peptide T5b [swine, platelets, Peptide Partial, 8 aa] [Sus scrofa]